MLLLVRSSMTSYAKLVEIQSNYTSGGQLVLVDCKTGEYEEFAVLDSYRTSATEEEHILIIKMTTTPLDAAMGQRLLALTEMSDRNKGGIVYGFVTTGESWRMLSYDGCTFKVTNQIGAVFDTIARDKEE